MTMSKTQLAIILLCTASLFGCSNSGSIQQQSVMFIEPNHRYIERNIRAEVSQGYVLGVSGADGVNGSIWSFALARVSGTATPHEDALQSIWAQFEEKHGAVGDRNYSLANIRFDSESLNLLLFTSTRLYVYADVVEFKKMP